MSVAPAGVIDSHCHLQSLAADDRERALDEARARGVAGFLVPAIRLADADGLLALAHRRPDVWCALGVHPHTLSYRVRQIRRRLGLDLDDPEVRLRVQLALLIRDARAPRADAGGSR